jgi:hypothetical protein
MVRIRPKNKVAKPIAHEDHDAGGPEQHRSGVATAGDEAGDRRGDRIGLAVEHQRQGDDTDGEDEGRKEAPDSKIDEREVGLLEGQDRAHHVGESGQSAGEEERKNNDRRARPDQQDHRQQGGEEADVGQVGAPGSEGREELRRFAVFDSPTQVVEPQCEERAEQQKACRESREERIGLAKTACISQPAAAKQAP